MPEDMFEMVFSKSTTVNGVPHVFLSCSDTEVDRQLDEMEKTALDDMLNFFKAGNVTLIDNHSSSFEMGKCVDGEIVKRSDGVLELVAEIALDMEHPFSGRLLKEIQDGTCQRGGSVGGRAKGTKYYNVALNKEVRKIVNVTELEHIAVTRPNRSAVASARFVGAIMKSVDWNSAPVDNTNRTEGNNNVDQKEFEKSLGDFTTALNSQKDIIENQKKVIDAQDAAIKKSLEGDGKIDLVKALGDFETAKVEPLNKQMGEILNMVKGLVQLNSEIIKTMAAPRARVQQPSGENTGNVADMLKSLGIGADGKNEPSAEDQAFEAQVKKTQEDFNLIKSKRDLGIELTDEEKAKSTMIGSQMLTLQLKGAKFTV